MPGFGGVWWGGSFGVPGTSGEQKPIVCYRWLQNHCVSLSFLTFWSRGLQKPWFFIVFFDFFDISGLWKNDGLVISSGGRWWGVRFGVPGTSGKQKPIVCCRWLQNHCFSFSFLTFWTRGMQKPLFFIYFFDFFDISGLWKKHRANEPGALEQF